MSWYVKNNPAEYSSETLWKGVQIVRADRKPCPICGHPTGDCIDPNNNPNVHVAGTAMAPPDKNLIRASRTVTKEIELAAGTTTTKVLVKEGDYIPITKAKELGLI